VLREIRKDMPAFSGHQIAVTVAPQVAHQLLGAEGGALEELSEELGRTIEVRARPGLHQEQFELSALDQGPPLETALPWLQERKPEEDPKPQKGRKSGRRSRSAADASPAESEKDEAPKELAAHAAQSEVGAAEPETTARPEKTPEPAPGSPEPEVAAQSAEETAEEAPVAASAEESPTEPTEEPAAARIAQALDEPADSRILPGSPTTPLSEES
jgi:hypothetical protein